MFGRYFATTDLIICKRVMNSATQSKETSGASEEGVWERRLVFALLELKNKVLALFPANTTATPKSFPRPASAEAEPEAGAGGPGQAPGPEALQTGMIPVSMLASLGVDDYRPGPAAGAASGAGTLASPALASLGSTESDPVVLDRLYEALASAIAAGPWEKEKEKEPEPGQEGASQSQPYLSRTKYKLHSKVKRAMVSVLEFAFVRRMDMPAVRRKILSMIPEEYNVSISQFPRIRTAAGSMGPGGESAPPESAPASYADVIVIEDQEPDSQMTQVFPHQRSQTLPAPPVAAMISRAAVESLSQERSGDRVT